MGPWKIAFFPNSRFLQKCKGEIFVGGVFLHGQIDFH